ncbi:hypothetical protein KGO95_01485 [Patescibacteria group bacterium]|nr:hypothetical protein [Patescibacteria group bacterium]
MKNESRAQELEKKYGLVYKLASNVSTTVGTLENLKHNGQAPTSEQVSASVEAKMKLQRAAIELSPRKVSEVAEYVERMAFASAMVPEGNRLVWKPEVSSSIANRLVSLREAFVLKTEAEAKQDSRWKICSSRILFVRSFINLAKVTGYEPRHGMNPRAVREVLEMADKQLKHLETTTLGDADKRMKMWESAKRLRSVAPKHWLVEKKPEPKQYQGESGSFKLGAACGVESDTTANPSPKKAKKRPKFTSGGEQKA